MVSKPDIDGDAQADLAGHGGEHRAVFVYQMDSSHYWERILGRNDFVAWQQGRKELFYPYGKTYLQTLGEQD